MQAFLTSAVEGSRGSSVPLGSFTAWNQWTGLQNLAVENENFFYQELNSFQTVTAELTVAVSVLCVLL